MGGIVCRATTTSNNDKAIRTYLKSQKITIKDKMLDTLCQELNDFGIERIDDFEELKTNDIDTFDLPPLIKRRFLKLISNGSTLGKWDYFISHAQTDGAVFAESIFYCMEKINKSCWMDVKMKERDEEAMQHGIANSNIFLMIVSKLYFTREFCIKHWTFEISIKCRDGWYGIR